MNFQTQFFAQTNANHQQQYVKLVEEPAQIAAYATPSQEQQFPSILEQAIQLVQQSAPIEYSDGFDLAEVEALIRSRAEDLADDDSSICESSTCFSPRSDISSPHSEASSSTTDDSDWTQKTSLAIGAALKAKQKRKPRKNRRSLEDRQSRKKEQNKTAANRYRLKKKAEIEVLLDEERELQIENDILQKEYHAVCMESKYIKKLLRTAFKDSGHI